MLDRHTFFGFHRLMQTVRPATPRHHSAGEFVDNDDLVVHDHVINIALEQYMSPQGGI